MNHIEPRFIEIPIKKLPGLRKGINEFKGCNKIEIMMFENKKICSQIHGATIPSGGT
ncbi:MAG TPA: hypothetical protein VK177_12240 [Flavobacteriales bacterium]|nr:hypothetical protein [Flavobacteriales bacterium]